MKKFFVKMFNKSLLTVRIIWVLATVFKNRTKCSKNYRKGNTRESLD